MFVYFIKVEAKPAMVKIGKARDPEERMAALQTGCPYELKLLGAVRCASDMHAEASEKKLHHQFRYDRGRGEWFRYTDTMARIIAVIVGKPIDQVQAAIQLARREVSHQKHGELTRKQRYRELERSRTERAIEAMREMDREFAAVVS